MKQARFIVALLLSLSIVIGLGNVFAQEDNNTIVDVITRATNGNPPQFTAISAALQASDITIGQTLRDTQQRFTLFAPADAAFSSLPSAALGGLLGNQALLSNILGYHVVAGYYPSSRIEEAITNDGGLTLTTLTGEEIVISRNERGTFVNDAFLRVDGGLDYLASNGVIHIIEDVLIPPTAQSQLGAILGGGASSETEAEEEAVEEEVTPPSTAEQVNSAIGRLLGAGAGSSDAEAEETEEAVEEEATPPSTAEQVNSAIGRLLGAGAGSSDAEAEEEAVEEEATPPSTADQVNSAIGRLLGSTTETEVNSGSASLADLLVESGNFEMLNMILANASPDYHAQLSADGEYTLFAPTDDAFNALASGLGIDLRAALAFPDILIDIVGYHVTDSIITGDDLAEITEFVTIQGESVAVSVVDGFIVLNGAVAISITDVEASNGVLHVVEGVLLPQSTIATFSALGLSLPE